MILPYKKYQIIYADPAWEYLKSGGIKSARGLAKKYYDTMKLDDIKKINIQQISDKNCYLFLWTTSPLMPEALDVMATWGFTFSNIVFTWIKTNKNTNSLFWGMGNSTRANPEYVLLGKKGKLKRQNADVHSVLLSPIKQHSQKPNEIRNRITRLYGDLPRIELFARTKVHGWDVIGNDEKLQNEPLEAYL